MPKYRCQPDGVPGVAEFSKLFFESLNKGPPEKPCFFVTFSNASKLLFLICWCWPLRSRHGIFFSMKSIVLGLLIKCFNIPGRVARHHRIRCHILGHHGAGADQCVFTDRDPQRDGRVTANRSPFSQRSRSASESSSVWGEPSGRVARNRSLVNITP